MGESPLKYFPGGCNPADISQLYPLSRFAFTAFFEHHWFILYKTTNKYIRDPDTCEEPVHGLFLKYPEQKKTFKHCRIWKLFKSLHPLSDV
jgi:hypothetical protein